LAADVGLDVSTELLDGLRDRVKAKEIADPDALLDALKVEMKDRLGAADRDLQFEPQPGSPNVWLFVGVNGVGKTTTIGKVGFAQVADGRSVVMAAGDTFRAAAAEQLETWAERAHADFVRGNEGGDPSAVIFDAIQRAAARDTDLVLADTAGRLHTKTNLMEELRKVRRVAAASPGRVTEVPPRDRRHHRPERPDPGPAVHRSHRGDRGADQARRVGQGRASCSPSRPAWASRSAWWAWAKPSVIWCRSTPTSSSRPRSPSGNREGAVASKPTWDRGLAGVVVLLAACGAKGNGSSAVGAPCPP
jgi:hypothetical protein